MRSAMAVVPWTYNNPRVNRSELNQQSFYFSRFSLVIAQDLSHDITVDKNTGFKLWDGAYLLAKYFDNNAIFPEGHWKGKKIVELGAGCGLVGMVLWALGGVVTLTDVDSACAHTRKCVEHNKEKLKQGNSENISVETLLWGDSDRVKNIGVVDYIVGSDVVYQKEAIPDLLKTMVELSGERTEIYLSYKPRGLGEDVFFHLLPEYDLDYETLPKSVHPAEFKNSDYDIIKIFKRKHKSGNS